MKTNCQFCNKVTVGRAGKKFCSADCKAKAHKQKKNANKVEIVQEINKILAKNRDILLSIIEEHKQKTVPRIQLSKQGFDFKYFTGTYLNRQGKTYHYIYDCAWMEFSTQDIMIVRK